MATGVSTRLTNTEGRKFGFTVGIALAIVGGISMWRGHNQAPFVLWTLGSVLLLAGLAVPTRLGPIYRAWMRLALAMSRIMSPLLMGIVYYIAVMPIGLLLRGIKGNPLARKQPDGSFWIQRDGSRAGGMKHQF